MLERSASGEHVVVVHPDDLRRITQKIYEGFGAAPEDAWLIADSLVQADLWGHPSHGVQRAAAYIRRVKAGSLDPRARGRVVRETETYAQIDGQNGFGQVVARQAMLLAIEKARGRGIAAVQVKNSNHFGTCGYWARLALPHDMIGFAATNASILMPPYGGREPRIGNNPWAFAIPAKNETPIVLDMAQAVAAVGKVQVAAQSGQRIPLTWATDRDGNPTDDPHEVLRGGMYLPIGGYKGFGQALVVEVLCGLLGGRAWGTIRGLTQDAQQPSRIGHFFFAIDIACFIDPAEFKDLVDQMVRGIRQTPLAPGAERVYSPGEPEAEAEARYRHGVPVLRTAFDELNRLAAEVGCEERLSPMPQAAGDPMGS